jgi:hypothetical protein
LASPPEKNFLTPGARMEIEPENKKALQANAA